MNDRPGAVLLIGNLGVGGIVRVLLNVVRHATRIRPAVAVRTAEGGLIPELPASVPLFDLGTGGRQPVASRSSQRTGRGRPPHGLTLGSLLAFWQECLALRRVLHQTRSTIVVTFIMRGLLIALVTRVLWARRLRLVVSLHEHVGETAAVHYPRASERWLMRLVIRHLYGRANAVLVPTLAMRDEIVRLGVNASRVVVRRNPVDLGAIVAAANDEVEGWAQVVPGTRLLVGVGRLVTSKQYDVLIRAMALLSATTSVRALILGEGPERAGLEALAERLGVRDAVRLPGPRANPWKYIARADCFVHPSRTEAHGLVLVEAMALGVPVIATSGSPGLHETLEGGRLGTLVPSGDPAAFAGAIARLLADPELRTLRIAQGRKAAAQYDLNTAVIGIEDVVLGSGPTP